MNLSTTSFAEYLLRWNETDNNRAMPWKGEKDPYKIWLSEIILQQTRVEQGLQYYLRFIENFPTVKHLATAEEQMVYKLWEGLGYYTRCKNMIAAARFIQTELNGRFPVTYDAIRKLKGVGPYTAAAIASFAFNLPFAVLDGNVFRVLSRYFGIQTPADTTAGRKEFSDLAQKLIPVASPGKYNQAIMDFGAMVCKPRQPACESCIFSASCFAYKNSMTGLLPVKSKQTKIRNRWFNYFIFEYEGQVYLRKRPANDIWENLYEYWLIETESETGPEKITTHPDLALILKNQNAVIEVFPDTFRQQLSHRRIYARFIRIKLSEPPLLSSEWKACQPSGIKDLAFPKIINQFHQAFCSF
ncbi:MAG TPA: A/G-specific adenine glycosylase [Parasegetibacter sp.]|jgi:A/G-specific adenine glycosylase